MGRIGLAMLQGARHEHIEALQGAAAELSVDLEVVELRRGDQVDATLDALVLPGGESTAIGPLAVKKYWYSLVFQGRNDPPYFFASDQELIEFVKLNPGAIAIVEKSNKVPENLKIKLNE